MRGTYGKQESQQRKLPRKMVRQMVYVAWIQSQKTTVVRIIGGRILRRYHPQHQGTTTGS